ncbi:MAG TPA: RHS repeat-associated core domain-containing protein, partial [Acidimicrobiales bacterium]
FLSPNGQGDITTVTSSTTTANALVCTARFDPFGSAQQPGATPCTSTNSKNDFFYRGGRRDDNTGQYQFGSRHYDPKKSAFLTPDSYRTAQPDANLSVGTDPLTRNTYTYVNGDPVNLVDPTGHEAWFRCPDGDCDPWSDASSSPAGMGMLTKAESTAVIILRKIMQLTAPCPSRPIAKPGPTTMSTYTAHGPAPTGCIPQEHKSPWRTALELVGFVPLVGDLVDGGLCIGSLATRNYEDAAWDCGAMIPIAGSLGRVAKHGDEIVDLATHGDELVDLASPARRRHILDGEIHPSGKIGGGHRAGTGFLDKTEFPAHWSDDQIMHYVADVATDPSLQWVREQGGDFVIKGTREGIDIKVVIRHNQIWSAYPTNTPRNR